MILSPGAESPSIPFTTRVGSGLVNGVSVSATVYRGEIATALTPTITNPATGLYFVSFTVPIDWNDFESANITFNATLSGSPISFTKFAGTVFADARTAAMETWQTRGLDPANPMTVTDTSRTVAGINQTISGNGTTTTVTRA